MGTKSMSTEKSQTLETENNAQELLAMIVEAPSLDSLMVLSPERFVGVGARNALIARLRAERAAWELKRGDRTKVEE